FKEEVIDDYATEFQAQDRSIVVKTANIKARDYINSIWDNEKFGLVPGKKFISCLSGWTSSTYKVSLNVFKIAREFKKEEIPSEVKELILSIEKGEQIKKTFF